MRRRFQQTMREDLIAAVVEHTGREVAAFLSDHHVDPDIAAEVFILKPRSAGERAAGIAGNGDGAGRESSTEATGGLGGGASVGHLAVVAEPEPGAAADALMTCGSR